MTDGRARLADHLASLDATRFVGRTTDLAAVERLFDGTTPLRVLLIHGPGGIGKSALLREIARRAEAAGRTLWPVDARALEPLPGELEKALDGSRDAVAATVTIDSFERVPALESLLRDRILPGLGADAVVVVAGRTTPGTGWFRDGWEHVVQELPLSPLPPEDAAALLAARGVTDPDITGALVDWAGGSPLALSLAASGGPAGRTDLDGVDLPRMIVERLAGDELGQVDAEVLELTAVARAVDPRLLAAVLPGRATRAAADALRRSTVAELVGGRITLHDLVRTSLRDDLRRRDRRGYDTLRQAIADHLLVRASGGETRLVSDLIELVDDPEVRWGIGGYAHDRFRIDPWRDEDAGPLVEDFLEQRGGDPRWWADLAKVLAGAPELGLVARDVGGNVVGFCVATSASGAPVAAEQDPALALLLADARARGLGDAMVYRESHRVVAPGGDAARGVLNLSAVLRSGLPNVSRSYILDTQPDADAQAFLQAVGAVHEPRLDVEIAGRRVACWVIDHGPGGMLGQIRDVVYAEAGPTTGASAPSAGEAELRQAAFDVLRTLHQPDLLATNALVRSLPGPSDPERVAQLRAAARRAVETAFDDTPNDRLLRDVVTLGDLDPSLTHEQAMNRLSVSRATYFRQLRKARQRVAPVLVQQRDEGSWRQSDHHKPSEER